MNTLFSRAVGVLVAAAVVFPGCSKQFIRGANDPSIDNPALSTGLDKDDIQRTLYECLNHLRASPVMQMWQNHHARDTVAIFPFANNTSEHIESQLQTILDETETWLVDSGAVTVISRERQNQLIGEVVAQQGAAFNQAEVAKYGRQLGVKFVMTGKMRSADERTDGMRRVQYFLFMQVIDVETGAIRWQHKAYVTKAVK